MINGLSNIPKISDSTRYRVRKLQKDLGQSEFYQFAIKNDPIIHEKIHHNDSYRLARAVEVMIETGKSIFDWRNSKKYPLVKSPSTESEAISKEKQERSYIIQMDQVYILLPDRELIYRNINQRFEQMFQLGAVEEVESIMKMNLDSTLPAMKAHGIPEIIEYLKGAITKEAAIEKAQLNTRHYAKRQYTWFKNQFPKAKFFQDTDFSISMLNKDL